MKLNEIDMLFEIITNKALKNEKIDFVIMRDKISLTIIDKTTMKKLFVLTRDLNNKLEAVVLLLNQEELHVPGCQEFQFSIDEIENNYIITPNGEINAKKYEYKNCKNMQEVGEYILNVIKDRYHLL